MPNQGNSNEQTTTYPRQTEGTRGECIHSCMAGVPTCASVSASSSSARACATSCALLAAWLARECQHLRISLFRRPPRFSRPPVSSFGEAAPAGQFPSTGAGPGPGTSLRNTVGVYADTPARLKQVDRTNLKLIMNEIGALMHRPVQHT